MKQSLEAVEDELQPEPEVHPPIVRTVRYRERRGRMFGIERGRRRLSPDGSQIVVSANDATRLPNIWLVDTASGRRSRLAGDALMPAWSPDGRQVAVIGAGGPLMLLTPRGGAPQPLVDPETDGRAVAFTSDESGRAEVYVATWPGLEQRAAVSTRGGRYPRWSRDSREIVFWQGRTMMAARVDLGLRPASAQPLFTGMYSGASSDPSFDVAPDGRFLVVQSDPRAALDSVTVLQHWAPLTVAR